MQYADQTMDIDSPLGLLRVIVTGCALKALAGRPDSPADAARQMNKHGEQFARIAMSKYESHGASGRGVVKITAHDLQP